ncbi:MAG: aldo/keto reductase, partial [Planctomycetes bacterium]|nr:aldo/keto reductase [Planctomycetota bacterium]
MYSPDSKIEKNKLSRRTFLGAGGALVVGGSAILASAKDEDLGTDLGTEAKTDPPKIQRYRVLGRTGYKVSDVSMGANRNRDPAVVRYACDLGINYIDTAERYQNGESERIIGEALKHIDRKKLFITTKIHIEEKDNEDTVLDRFKKCLDRLNTDYIDAFFMHGVNNKATLDHPGFHAATTRLKTEGRLKHIGVSSHGSRNPDEPSMEEALCAAA